MKRSTVWLLLTFVLSPCCSGKIWGRENIGGEPPTNGLVRVYVGTYTRGESKGIYLCRLDLQTGELRAPALAGETVNPSFLAIHPSRECLYAVGEIGNFAGKKSGAVSAFRIDRKSDKLKLINHQLSGGRGPCHLVVDPTGKNVLVANYGGGSIAVLPIGEGGRLGEATALTQRRARWPRTIPPPLPSNPEQARDTSLFTPPANSRT